MKKNIRILYLKDSESQNNKFINFLKREYKVRVSNCVLPNIYEEKFGQLNIDPSSKTVYDFEWGEAIGCVDSKEDITYNYGFDSHYEDTNTRAYHFKLIFSNYLKSLNFKFTRKSIVKDIISSIKKSTIFIREKELKYFDLIIIEKLATAVFEDNPVVAGKKKNSLKKLNITSYIKYKITPNLLNKLLNSNIKLIHLMDFDKSTLHWLRSHSQVYNKMLEKIGMSSFSMGKHLNKEYANDPNQILVGVDFENRFKDEFSKFHITIDDKFKQQISKKYLPFYRDVTKINVDCPIQLSVNNSYKIQNRNKIVLRGNIKTTKLYANWDVEYWNLFKNEIQYKIDRFNSNRKYFSSNFPVNHILTLKDFNNLENLKHFLESDTVIFSPINNSIFDRLINSETLFGIADVSEDKSYIALSGNLCRDSFFINPLVSNRIFLINIIDYFTTQMQISTISNNDFLPKIKIDVPNGELFINKIKIVLQPMQFCYYRFFVERAKKGKSLITAIEEFGTEYNVGNHTNKKGEIDYKISSYFIGLVIDYFKESHPGKTIRQELEVDYDNKITPSYKYTFKTQRYNINNKIKSELEKTLSDSQISKVQIFRQGENEFAEYGINLPSENIEIIPLQIYN